MRIAALFPTLIIMVCCSGLAAPVKAADAPASQEACLSRVEQRTAIESRQAVPLVEAVKSLRSGGHREEMVRARLCRNGERLVYVLTLLSRNGKVAAVTVDAANGELINGH